ncbi:MAG: hypothetical protein NTZ26_14630 [Candidatus Aminicenantes bacterium]|nr:hypothetical protein [Candidatus Aminicenantes bacterium]
MKRLLIIGGGVCLLAAVAFPQTLSLALRGGAGFASGGDLSRGLQGLMDYYAAEYDGLTGEHSFQRLGWTAGGELLFHLSPRLAIGLGAGYEMHGKESVVEYGIDAVQVTETLTPKLAVIPVTASLHLFLPVGGKIKIDLSAGGGAYLTRLDWTSSYRISLLGYTGTDDFHFQGSKWGLGAHAGLGLEWSLTPALAATLNITGRWVRVSGFQGDWTETGAGDFWSFTEGGSDYSFFYYDWSSGSTTYPQVVFQTDVPQGTTVANARQARIDLTGFTATVGIRLNLF